MADKQNVQSGMTEQPDPPMGNDPSARTSDGTLKDARDASPPSSTPTPSPSDAKSTAPAPKPDESKPTVAPDKYEAFKAPDGVTLDDKTIERITPVFKELGLTQAAAQKLVDFYGEQMKSNDKAIADAVTNMRSGWRDEISKSSDMGGKVEQIKVDVGHMLDSIFAGDPKGRQAYQEAMDLTGAGDNPHIVRAWWKAAQSFTEGTHISGSGPSPAGQKAPGASDRPSLAQAMYPHLVH